MTQTPPVDVAIIGGGAAGLATAIFAARHDPHIRIALLDGAKKLGAKILVSGGGRCNVTNVRVTPDDYFGGSRNIIRKILAAFPVEATVAFFKEIGVDLYEDYAGKLFPKSDAARTVLDTLLAEAARRGVELRTDHRVSMVEREERENRAAFRVETSHGVITAHRVVIATGGLSLPKTGSDGAGYAIARALGHTIVPTTPGLVPLALGGALHSPLSGISHDAEIVVRVDGEKPVRLSGALLWTHFGISGPLAMDVSRVWHRAVQDGRRASVALCFLPGRTLEAAEADLLSAATAHPKRHIENLLSDSLPARVADAILRECNIAPSVPLAHLKKEDRRRLLRALLEWPLVITGSRGYAHAEVTAGGVPLTEIDPATMESRCCKGLYLVGEILDCDGRIGGFNFQWAWSTGFVAGRAIAARRY